MNKSQKQKTTVFLPVFLVVLALSLCACTGREMEKGAGTSIDSETEAGIREAVKAPSPRLLFFQPILSEGEGFLLSSSLYVCFPGKARAENRGCQQKHPGFHMAGI